MVFGVKSLGFHFCWGLFQVNVLLEVPVAFLHVVFDVGKVVAPVSTSSVDDDAL